MAVGVALLILYFVHYVFLALGARGSVSKEALVPMQKRIHSYGIACKTGLKFQKRSPQSYIFSSIRLSSYIRMVHTVDSSLTAPHVDRIRVQSHQRLPQRLLVDLLLHLTRLVLRDYRAILFTSSMIITIQNYVTIYEVDSLLD